MHKIEMKKPKDDVERKYSKDVTQAAIENHEMHNGKHKIIDMESSTETKLENSLKIEISDKNNTNVDTKNNDKNCDNTHEYEKRNKHNYDNEGFVLHKDV